MAGSWNLGAEEQSQSAVDCRETVHRDVREEIAEGTTFGGKLGSHADKAILLNHVQGMEPSL